MYRIALYSPGMVGLGHIRRNLLIAQSLAASERHAATLVIGEARQAGSFNIPPGVDTLTLPALRKVDGQCEPRYLDISLRELVAMRAQAILGTLRAFDPDLLIVDHLPRGAVGELEPTLAYLRRSNRTRLVLGLRDVLEAPETVRREWAQSQSERAIRSSYDSIWVYGDRRVYDLAHEYGLAPDVAARLRYAGYLDPQARTLSPDHDALAGLGLPPGRLNLCMVGGGQDGEDLALAFAAAAPPDSNSVVVTGPFMPAAAQERLRALAAANPRLRVLEFHEEPNALMRQADRLIAMGGYNTVCEALAFDRHTLVVPRAAPRMEQRIRADRLSELGLLHVLPAEQLSPQAIAAWLAADLGPRPQTRSRIDMGGLARLPILLDEVLGQRRGGAPRDAAHNPGPWSVAA